MIKETIYCDRCGKEYKNIRDSHGFRLMKRRHFIEQLKDGIPQKLDLCQSCYDSLAEWMNMTERSDKE